MTDKEAELMDAVAILAETLAGLGNCHHVYACGERNRPGVCAACWTRWALEKAGEKSAEKKA